MSFVLSHRPHYRVGQQPLAFHKIIEYDEESYNLDLTKGGYVFELEEPLRVEVLEGRIRGKLQEPITFGVPKYDDEVGAYVTPDGGAVQLKGNQLVEVPMPVPDGGIIDQILDPFRTLPTTAPPSATPPRPRTGQQPAPRPRRSFFGKPES